MSGVGKRASEGGSRERGVVTGAFNTDLELISAIDQAKLAVRPGNNHGKRTAQAQQ